MHLLLQKIGNNRMISDQFMQHCQSYVEYFSSQYGPVACWPTPFNYAQWYDTIGDYQSSWLHPNYYNIVYEQGAKALGKPKTNKLSRGQKRRLKKKQMESELEEEKKAIGNWVKYQRKDLIDGIERIEAKEKKEKEKKSNKLSHLIQIHKEVFKHHQKKSTGVDKKNRRVPNQNKKKRLSYIKKMKQIFSKQSKDKKQATSESQPKNIQAITEQEFLTDSQDQNEENEKMEKVGVKEKKIEVKDKKVEGNQKENSKQAQLTQVITYDKIGKLTGKLYNGFYLREWVTNYPSQELQDIVLRVINRLAYKQAIKKINTPEKAKKLIVSGIKECRRTIKTINDKKLSKFIILALNIERNNLQKGVDDQIQTTLKLAQQKKIAILHASTRSKLGRAFTGKFGPRISMISIINYQGYQDMIEEMTEKWNEAKLKYNQI